MIRVLLFPRLYSTPWSSRAATVSSYTPALHSEDDVTTSSVFILVCLSRTLGIHSELFVPKSQHLLKTSLGFFVCLLLQKRYLHLVLAFMTKRRLLLQQVYCYSSVTQESSLQSSLSKTITSSKVPTLPTEFLFSLLPILEIVSRNREA